MKKLKSNFINMVLVLCSITIIAAFALSSVYLWTKDIISRSMIEKQLSTIKSVMPPHDHFDTIPLDLSEGVEIVKVYKAYDKNNNIVGAAVENTTNNGYKGHFNVFVGFDKDGKIINYDILEQNETPGLGSKVEDWFKTNKNQQSIIGKNASIANLSVKNDGGDIDAITGATITSRAFLFAVRNAHFAFINSIDFSSKDSKIKTDSTQNPLIESTSTINNSVLNDHKK
jgi:electron transport complex protein RnfG